MKCLTLNNWAIVELTDFVAIGILNDGSSIYSDKILAIVDGHLVTNKNIFKLGKVDKVWNATAEAKIKLEKFDENHSLPQ